MFLRTKAGCRSLVIALCALIMALPAVSAAQPTQRSAPVHHKAHKAPKALVKKPATHRAAATKPRPHAKKAPRRAPPANKVALHKPHRAKSWLHPPPGHRAAADSNLNPAHRPYAPPAEKHVAAEPGQQRTIEHADKPTESSEVTKAPVAPSTPASPTVASPKTPVSPTPPTLPKDDAPAAPAGPGKMQ